MMSRPIVAAWVLALVLGALSALAQPPQPPIQPNPQAPTIAPPFPLGAQRGTTLDLTLTGANLADPTGVLLSFPAKVAIPTDNNNGKDNAKLLVRVEVPKDAPLGYHTLRVATRRGISNFRLFCVDDLPQVVEASDNRTLASAQAVPVPCVVCGKADAEQTDYFKFTVQPGQRLSFELLGRRLGSAFDPQLSLLDAKSGKQLAFSDDAPGQSKDPRLTYTFKEAGEYALAVRDVRYQGGGDWYYRLRIGDFPCATTPVPLAAKRGSTVPVTFAGPQVEGVAPVTVSVPKGPEQDVLWLTPTRPGAPAGWPVALVLTDLDEAVETEPNDDPAKATRVRVPGAVSARFAAKADRDHFVFTATKGQRLLIEAQTHEFHSPTAVYMVLRNAAGQQVAASDPKLDPARIDFTAPADSDYTLFVEHLHYWGGPDEAYRVSFLPYEPTFSLTAGIDRLDIPQGGSAVLLVQANRRDYTGPITVRVAQPAGISGTATIPAGKTATLLNLTAAPDAALAPHRLVLLGEATINGKPVADRVDVRAVISREMGNLPVPPRDLWTRLAVAVTEKPPFTIQAKPATPDAVRGTPVPVVLTVTKASGFDEEITITSLTVPVAQGQPPPFPPVNVKIPKGSAEAKVQLTPPANAPLGPVPLSFIGRTKFAGRDYAVTAPAIELNLALPFDLVVDAGGGQLTAGDKLTLKVKAVRKGGYQGPITLEVRNLPANVTAPKATIPEKQDAVEIELTAAANAALGEKKDVNVLGTATAANNQQNASANFTLTVVKKP
jgi:hypothetical protein